MTIHEGGLIGTSWLVVLAILGDFAGGDEESHSYQVAMMRAWSVITKQEPENLIVEILEDEGMIEVTRLELMPFLLTQYWKNNPHLEPEQDDNFDYVEYVTNMQEQLNPIKTISNLEDEFDLDKLLEIEGGIFVHFKVKDKERIIQEVNSYIDGFESNKLRIASAFYPWPYEQQMAYLRKLIASKTIYSKSHISVTDVDFYSKGDESRQRFMVAESILSAAKKRELTINDMGMDYINLDDKGFPQFYAQLTLHEDEPLKIELPVTASENKERDSIHLTADSYSVAKGILHVSGISNVYISKAGNAYRPPKRGTNKKKGEMYDQCRVMALLFKNVNTLNRGVKISQALGVSDTYMTQKHEKKIKNLVTAINGKVKEKTGADRLIIIDGKMIRINKSYL